MKIIKFGVIQEDEDGSLKFQNFSINCTDEYASTYVCLLKLVIARLQDELAQNE